MRYLRDIVRDRRLVRFGYVATASLTIGLAGVIGVSGMLQAPGGVQMIEAILGWPMAEILAQWSEVQPFLLDLGDEALQLMGQRPLGLKPCGLSLTQYPVDTVETSG